MRFGWPGTMKQEEEPLIKPDRNLQTATDSALRKPQLSRWKSSEFFVYYGIILFAAFFTIKECILISLAGHPVYNSYSHLLSDGWLFNLKMVIILMILFVFNDFICLGFE